MIAPFFGNFGALLSRFGKPDRNRLLATFYSATFAPFSRTEGAFLLAANRAFNSLTSRLTVLAATRFLA